MIDGGAKFLLSHLILLSESDHDQPLLRLSSERLGTNFVNLPLRFFLLFFLLGTAACQQQEPPPLPLLTVGQRQLSLGQFERELQSSYPDFSSLEKDAQLALKKQLINQLIEREMILGETDRLAVQIGPDELDAALRKLRGSYSAEEFTGILREAGQTQASWSTALKLRLLTEKVSAAVIGSLSQVSAQEAEAYYLQHRDSFRRPAELRARQMLLPDIGTAKHILKRLRDGEKFAALAKENSRSPDRETGGNLGYFSQGQLPAEFDKVLFRLPTGQVSDPVESPYGIHLFLVERRRKAGLRPYKQVEGEIIALLKQQKEEDVFQLWLDKLHEQTSVKVNWQLLLEEKPPEDRLFKTLKTFLEDI